MHHGTIFDYIHLHIILILILKYLFYSLLRYFQFSKPILFTLSLRYKDTLPLSSFISIHPSFFFYMAVPSATHKSDYESEYEKKPDIQDMNSDFDSLMILCVNGGKPHTHTFFFF